MFHDSVTLFKSQILIFLIGGGGLQLRIRPGSESKNGFISNAFRNESSGSQILATPEW